MSHPTWVRGLKPYYKGEYRCRSLSHPTWVRGLKQTYIDENMKTSTSHPTWVRGLKQKRTLLQRKKQKVAPYVGAWIETALLGKGLKGISRTLRGCVD